MQQRMEGWKQRSKILAEQIHAVDPYYVLETRFVGQASYADIAAGRTNSPSSRNCSPYRQQRDAAQVLRPAIAQKLNTETQVSKTRSQERINEADRDRSLAQMEIRAETLDGQDTHDEERQRDVPDVVVESSSVSRRGRSPTRKLITSKARDSKTTVASVREDMGNSRPSPKREARAEPSAKNTLAPRDEQRGRSPSPMWVPGSTSYADILRGCAQTQINVTSAERSPSREMVPLSAERLRDRAQVSYSEKIENESLDEVQQVATTREMENAREEEEEDEVYQPSEISAEKVEEEEEEEEQNYAKSGATDWADEAQLEEYDVLQHVAAKPQPTEIFEYMISEPMPELVGFIGSPLGTYSVGSYVYAPSGHQIQQLDTINLHPYNDGSLAYAPEHYVAQTAYLPTPEIYQQTTSMQQCPAGHHASHTILMENPGDVDAHHHQVDTTAQSKVTEDAIEAEPELEPDVSNAETSASKTEREQDATSFGNTEKRGQAPFSYAQILSQGLGTTRVTPTRVVNKSPVAECRTKDRAKSSSSVSRESSPLQKSKSDRHPDSHSSVATKYDQPRQSKDSDWDTMKKREIRKRHQQPNDKSPRTDENKSRRSAEKKQRKEVASSQLTAETRDRSARDDTTDKTDDSSARKDDVPIEEEEQRATDPTETDASPLPQEKKRRQKKRRTDKSAGDEIDKALREIEDMDKQKAKAQREKFKEQSKEQIRSQIDPVGEEKSKADRKVRNKSGEKSRKSGRSREAATRDANEDAPADQLTLLPPSRKTTDRNVTEENIESKEEDARVLDLKDEENVQKNNIAEVTSKEQIARIISDKSKAKRKNKAGKSAKEQDGRVENKAQQQSEGSSDSSKTSADENKASKQLSVVRNVESENTDEKRSAASAKIESARKQRDDSKKEKTRMKSRELPKTEAEDDIKSQDGLKDNNEEIIDDKSSKSIEATIDDEAREDPESQIQQMEGSSADENNEPKKLLIARNIENTDERKQIAAAKIESAKKQRDDSKKEKKTRSKEPRSKAENDSKDQDKLNNEEIIDDKSSKSIESPIGNEGKEVSKSKVSSSVGAETIKTASRKKEKTSQSKTRSEIAIDDTALQTTTEQTEVTSTDAAKFESDQKSKRTTETCKIAENVEITEESCRDISLSPAENAQQTQKMNKNEIERNKSEIKELTRDKESDETDIELKSSLECANASHMEESRDGNVTRASKQVERLSEEKQIKTEKQKRFGKTKSSVRDKPRKDEESRAVENEYVEKKNVEQPIGIETVSKRETQEPATAFEISSEVSDVIRARDSESAERPRGKALIIEKTITTVTTTSGVPASDVKSSDVKSVKSVEILENIPLPKIVGSKVTEFITLRPETVEASLTTTYARVSNDSPVDNCPLQQQVATGLSQKSNPCYPVTPDESILFGSVKTRTRAFRSENHAEEKKEDNLARTTEEKELNSLGESATEQQTREKDAGNKIEILENGDIAKSRRNVDDENVTAAVLLERQDASDERENRGDDVANKIIEDIQENEKTIKTESKTRANREKTEKKIADKGAKRAIDYLDLVKPYAFDYHVYSQAERNLHRFFKVVKVVRESQPPVAIQTRPESVEKVVQKSVMKPIELIPESTSLDVSEVDRRRHAVVMDAPKYPIASLHEFESQAVKTKSFPRISASKDDEGKEETEKKINAIEDHREKAIDEKPKSIETKENLVPDAQPQAATISDVWNLNKISEDKESTSARQSVRLVSDDAWMSILDEPILIDDDFDEAPEENTMEEATKENLLIDNQLTKPDASVGTDKIVAEDNTESKREVKVEEPPATVHLKSDDDWLALLDEEIPIDDDDEEARPKLENVAVEDQVEERESAEEKEIERPREEKEVAEERETEKLDIERSAEEKETSEKSERASEERKSTTEKSNEEKNREVARGAASSELGARDVPSESEKQSDNKARTKSKKKKESKHSKERAKDQAQKTRAESKRPSDVAIKADGESDLSQTTERNKIIEDKTDDSVEQVGESLIVVERRAEPPVIADDSEQKTRDPTKEEKPNRSEERKSKSSKKQKKQSEEKSEMVRRETSAEKPREVFPKEKTRELTDAPPSLEDEMREELKVTIMDEIVRPAEEKLAGSTSKQSKDGSKSYAQVAAASSPQASPLQEEILSHTDDKIIDETISDEAREHHRPNTETSQSPLEQAGESILSSVVPDDSLVDSKDTETRAKPETNTWAAIVGKKSVESQPEDSNVPILDLCKSEQKPLPPTHVQIYVEETPAPEPLENLVQIDDQGFVEFVNRRELRSRRSRSRSRSARRRGDENAETRAVERKTIEETPDARIEDESKQETWETFENGEVGKVVSEEEEEEEEETNAVKSKDKMKPKKSERRKEIKKQTAEGESEGKTIREAKSERDEGQKSKKSKSKKKKDQRPQQAEVDEQIEAKEASKSRAETETQVENVTTECPEASNNELIKETKIERKLIEIAENKRAEILPEQVGVAKSKKKSRSKKGKIASEQTVENISGTDKNAVGDLTEKIEPPAEPKLDNEMEIKHEEAITASVTRGVATAAAAAAAAENDEIPTEMTKTEETTAEQTKADKITEEDAIETMNTCEKPQSEKTEEKIVARQIEISKSTRAEKKKQRKRGKVSSRSEEPEKDTAKDQSGHVDSNDANILEKDQKPSDEIPQVPQDARTIAREDSTNSETLASLPVEDKEPIKIEKKRKQKSSKKRESERHKEDAVEIIVDVSEESRRERVTSIEPELEKRPDAPDEEAKREDGCEKRAETSEVSEELAQPTVELKTETCDDKRKDEPAQAAPDTIVDVEKTELPKSDDSLEAGDGTKVEPTSDNVDSIDIVPKHSPSLTKSLEDEENLKPAQATPDHIFIENVELSKSDDILEPCDSIDSINIVPSHSPTLTKSSFEDENESRQVASNERESFTSLVEPPKSKVQFYIADEMLVLNFDRRKKDVPSTPPFRQEKTCTNGQSSRAIVNLSDSRFLSIDDGFWPDKRPYHEAERDHFENLASKKNIADESGRDFDERDDNSDGGGGVGGGGGRSRDSCGNSRSFLGTPYTERMIADLPGGICSWSDYSTYLSSESERTPDQSLPIDDPTVDSCLSPDRSPSDVRSSSSSSSSDYPSSQVFHETKTPVEASPRKRSASSSSLQNPIDPNTHHYHQSSTITPATRLGPQSKLHLGKETREEYASERCSPNGDVGRDTVADEAGKRICRIQATVEEDLASLQAKLSSLEGTMSSLPQDSIESMLSSLMAVVTDLRAYDNEVAQLQKKLRDIPADSESQKLLTSLTGIHTRLTNLLDQAEAGRATLEQARASQENRDKQLCAYKSFLEETDAWLRNVTSKLHEQHSFNTNKLLQEELTSRAQRISEHESLPEVSALARKLMEAVLDVINRLQQKQQEICDEEARADDESTERDNATLDEAPSIHSSLEDGQPSMADVSLQTGRSLLIDDVEKKAQLTKQTSTTQMPTSPPPACHSLMTQTTQVSLPSKSVQTQEAIKVLKTTRNDQDVIEIATKYVPSNQETTYQEQTDATPGDDIVVDMKYQDAKKTDSSTSELNIVHVAPQSFETVLVEPDDVVTEVVVDADGTKRIIVRKLRRTTTVRQTTEQCVSAQSAAATGSPMIQAFSEAAMRDQQVTVTRTRPDGTIETTTKQVYGGRVATNAPAEGINVEEYESEPRYTRMVTQGQIEDIQPAEEEMLTEGKYQTRTSSVHAVVQQVTRRIIKRTRKIIRKVVIIDGKEVTTEEVIEEPEEVEIDEQNIPHISINVVKSEDQKTITLPEKAMDQQEATRSEPCIIGSPVVQGPFFGPFAKDMTSARRDEPEELVTVAEGNVMEVKTLEDERKEDAEEPTIEAADYKAEDSARTAERVATDEGVSSTTVQDTVSEEVKSPVASVDKDENFPAEVNGVARDNQTPIDVERSTVLQTPVEETRVTQPESSPLAVTDDEPAITKATCKSDDAPVKSEALLSIELENGTVEVEMHHDGSGTVEADKDVSDVVVLEKDERTKDESLEPFKTEGDATTLLVERADSQSDLVVSQEKLQDVAEPTLPERSKSAESPEKRDVPSELLAEKEEEDSCKDEALKPEYKPVFHKLEISLAVRNEDEEAEPLVSIRTQAERPEIAPYSSIVREDVDISLPADRETMEVIHDKIVQTAFLTAEKQTETAQRVQAATMEKEINVNIESEKSRSEDSASHKSRKKKRHKTKPSEKAEEETESSSSVPTSIVESMEINVPLSDSSSKHVSEQPQPDVTEIMKPESSLTLTNDTATENGYQPDDKVLDELSVAPEDKDSAKKKRKKKKKQNVRFDRDDNLTPLPRTSSDDATFTDDSLPLEVPKLEEMIEQNKAKEDVEEDNEMKEKIEAEPPEEVDREIALDDANTQTIVETCDASTSLTPRTDDEILSTFMQTSPEPVPLTLEEEIQTAKTEETHIETQTVAEFGLDFSTQTIEEEAPRVEDSGVQTATPTAIPTEDFAMQTVSQPDDARTIAPVTETEDSQAQTTVIDVLSTEMQTSPIEVAPMIATETQTPVNTVTEIEQQTSPPPVTEKVTVQETVTQTSSEVPERSEKNVQTSVPTSPEQPDVSDVNTQTIASAESTETQTTPKESPRKADVQETEMQTKSPEPTRETMMQTSPIFSPEPVPVCEESAQTSLEDVKETTEEESQTSSPRKTPTLDSSVQIKTEELIPKIEESTQNIPETCEISAQTLPKEEEQSVETISVSQQTVRVPTCNVVVSTDSFEIEKPKNEEDTSEISDSAEAVLPEDSKPEEEVASAQLKDTPAAPDVQVLETVSLPEEKVSEAKTVVDEPVPETPVEETSSQKATRRSPEKSPTEVSPKPRDIARTKESTPSLTSDKESTPDTSLEIHVHATIELSGTDTLDNATSCSKETTTEETTSRDTTIAESLDDDAAQDGTKAVKRQKRKRKHKTTTEISVPKDQQDLESIFGQVVESQNAVMKLSYSDVAKKNISRQTSPRDSDVLDDNAVPERSLDEEMSKPDDAASRAVIESTDERHSKPPVTSVTSQAIPASDQFLNNSNRNIPESRSVGATPFASGRPKIELLQMSPDRSKSSDVDHQTRSSSDEPMDTTEEPLTPTEIEQSSLSKEIVKPSFQTEIKTYVDVISESQKKPTTSPGAKPQGTSTMQAKIVTDRVKNLQNSNELSYLGNILHIAHLEEVTTEKLTEERSSDVHRELTQLKAAVDENDMVIVEETLITVVETISTWLETIEYRIFLNRECPTGPSHEDTRTFVRLKDEVNHVEETIRELDNIWKQVEPSYSEEERNKLRECVDALEHQVKIIEHVTADEENHVSTQLAKWDEFLNGVNNVYRLVEEQRKQLDHIIESEYSTQWKLRELDKLENTNRCHMWKTSKLLNAAHRLLRNHPGKIIPEETYAAHEITKIIEYSVCVERERLLQLLALAEEYEQTLREFAQITEIAENLLDSPISVMSLEHLQEEMQKHRKFFVNLNHCRAILESLEGNLDPETRAKHSDLHEELHGKATALLDQAASRAQQMALAASRWILLEQGVKEERGWLQVAHQRVPDLQTVTSIDYDQYISLYQSLSSDVATHHARLIQLLGVARGLRDLINIEDPEDRYSEALDVIVRLQDDIKSSLRRLLAFREKWINQETLTNRVEHWMTTAEKDLATLQAPSGSFMRQFWELKAQYEVYNNMRNEADNCFEQALRIVPLSDEMLQRQFHYELQDRWNDVSDRINEIQKDITRSISSEDISSNEKLKLLERELNELRMTINSFHGVLKTEEELDLYVERLTVLFDRIAVIQDEIGRLGLLPAAESERVGILLSSARCIEGQIGEELDSAQLLREKIQALKRGLGRFRKAHERLSATLDQCESSEKQESDLVAAAVDRCQSVADELMILWQDLMALRQMLHNLPTGMRVTVSPVGIERDLSNIQDAHTELESRCARLLSLLTNRLEMWRRFERQLELVQQSVQEADYMMELLTVQDSVDYDRLLKATERLEGLSGDLGAREVLVGELRAAAEPLRESCAAEVRERVDAAVNEAVQAWEDTRAELDALCTKYQHACRLWQQYRDSSAAVKAWVDVQMNSMANLPPEEAAKQVKVCEETLAEHKERLAELRGLVAQIASDVGLDAGGPLHCEVEALGQRLEDVRETLSTLADTVDARVLNQELARSDLCQTKNFLDSVQQSLTTVGQGETNEQLTVLRNYLLTLTRTEPQLQSIKDRALDVNVHDPLVVEVVQLWQRVFLETFQQYLRLSTRLIRSQDVVTALKLWQDYLTHVQDFLSSGVPSDYDGLLEHRNLCEVHRKLLQQKQQTLMFIMRQEEDGDLSVTEQFSTLTNLHNETLARILERHAAVRDKISAWDRYRLDRGKLLTWLNEIERERQRMHLRFIHLRQLNKILQRIQALLDKLPAGEAQIKSLQEQQESLLRDCDEELAVSIRMEHAANAQHISNLRAGLETWRDFVQRVQKLHKEHDEQSAAITAIFQEVGQVLSAAFHAGPTSLSKTKEKLDSLQHLRTRLTDAQRTLESLGGITEQLRECVSPSDMRTLNQHDALLSQQHGDLEYQLALLAYRLGERYGFYDRWESRLNKFLSWIEDATVRRQNYDPMTPDDPEETVKRFECELQTEMNLKQPELEWLQTTGQELIELAEEAEKTKLQQSLDRLNDKWNSLMTGGKARANKLSGLIQTMNSLLKRISDLRTWLTGIENQLSEPLIIEKPTQQSVDKKFEDHEHLKSTIEAESGNIGEVLNLCEILLNDCDVWKASFNTDALKSGMEGLERRWKTVCVKSTERKKKIAMIWKLLQELDKIRCEHEPWLVNAEKSLTELQNSLTDVSKEESEKLIDKAKSIAQDIEAHQKALKMLEQMFGRLAKSGLDPDNFRSLTGETRKIIERWLSLEKRISAIISSIQREQKTYHEFVAAHGAAVVGLAQVDVRLTQMQHLATPEQTSSLRRRRQQLSEIEEELDTQNVILRKADELALRVMQDSNPEDVAAIQELVDEYQLMWQDIKARVTSLRAELEHERTEVDEAVQVETLKFEQDTAVQVDTLPRLVRMTSCDAYLMELEAALNECNNSLNALEAAVTPDPVSGPGLNAAAKTIAKLIGSSQSSIELVRHLHNLLVEDGKLSPGAAKSREVTTLIARYDTLIAQARAREQLIRELRSPVTDAYAFPCNHDNGRLTCPLCSRRNWAQLDNDLWRLNKWLEYAEGTQSEQHSPPGDIEQLEDVIQDHREFLLDLDSHKSIVTSLNIVGAHLADHAEDTERANELRDRLAVANNRWEKICTTAARWQEQLQRALMTNHQFYRIIDELLAWLERTEVNIRASEPIDLTESANIIEAKYNKFRELRSDLERCEPRVISLQEAANQLLDEETESRARLQELRLRLQSLRRLTGIYAVKLGAALGLESRDVGLAATSTSLASLSHELLDEAASGTAQPHITGTDGEEGNRTVLARGYYFLGRVLRVSLPIQALMLLLLGVASLVPSAEEDYSCTLSNNLARSFTPIAFYPNGPPPV